MLQDCRLQVLLSWAEHADNLCATSTAAYADGCQACMRAQARKPKLGRLVSQNMSNQMEAPLGARIQASYECVSCSGTLVDKRKAGNLSFDFCTRAVDHRKDSS